MQGQKNFQAKMFVNFCLADHIPKDNFYRVLKDILDLQFIKKKTQFLYSKTGRPRYAVEGYELNVVDYLLKPFPFERFLKAVNKASDLSKLKNKGNSASIISPEDSATEKNYILVKSEHKVHRIFYKEIRYIQSMREYVAYYTSKGRILSLGSLKKLEVDLPKEQFVRIHKSYIISKEKVTTLEGNMIHIVKEKIPIGASYREEVLELLF